MSLFRGLLARQPTIITTVVTAAVGLAIGYGAPIPPEAKAPLIALIVALATAFLHQSVVSPATAAAAVEVAATRTAEQLTTTTVGAAGTVTEAAGNVVTGVVNEVVSGVGGLVGALAPTGGKTDA